MRHSRNKLSVNRVKALGKGAHGDGGGLWLIKDHPQGGRWVYRFRLHGRNRSMGLGSVRKITLADARKRRNECETLLSEGIDPQAERERRKRAASHTLKTFAEVAESAFESKRAEIKGEGNEKRWFGPLKLHVLPKIGERSMLEITQIDLREVLAPLWHTKADTARKALNRINIIYKHASALGLEVDTFIPAKTKEVAVDFDPMIKKLPSPMDEIAKAWVHTGLQDTDGGDKSALNVWAAYLGAYQPN
ncbi:MAG: integrase arm-type DNA-binding domain-containing protein [Pseudomonadota bacterium]